MHITKDWTLFLDRDGVINIEKKDDYIYSWDEFRFYPDALAVLKKCAEWFAQVIIITNQKGIGKKLMTENDLKDIHENMLKTIELSGGRIDAIYHCCELDNDHPMRKPQAGMGLAAKNEFPDIDFAKSIMVGNNISDMAFGKALQMQTVFLSTTQSAPTLPHPLIDYTFPNLSAFANAIQFDSIGAK